MRRAGLHADLADALEGVAALLELLKIPFHVNLQLFHRAVFAAHFADLPAHRNRDAFRLQIADHGGQFRRQREVGPLLILDRGLRQVHQRGGVDVNVVKPAFDGFPDQILDRLRLLFRIRGKFFSIHLEVVALKEDRPAPAGFHGGRRNGAGVFQRSLPGVVDFRPGNFKKDRPDVSRHRGAENRLRHIVADAADVDGRNRKAAHFPAPHRIVEGLYRRGHDPQRGRAPANQKARGFPRSLIGTERHGLDQVVNQSAPKPFFIQNADVPAFVGESGFASFFQLIFVFVNHGCSLSFCYYCDRYSPAIFTSAAEPI